MYWFKGIQGGRSEGSGTRLMKLDTNGDLEVAGRVEANSVKELTAAGSCFCPQHNYQDSQLGSDAETCHGLVRKLWKRRTDVALDSRPLRCQYRREWR